MLAMLDGCSNIHITAKPYSMKVSKGEEVLDILQLSDGEKCTLALFGDLARRLAIANPTLENPLEGVGQNQSFAFGFQIIPALKTIQIILKMLSDFRSLSQMRQSVRNLLFCVYATAFLIQVD